jgi:hypothetical protein
MAKASRCYTPLKPTLTFYQGFREWQDVNFLPVSNNSLGFIYNYHHFSRVLSDFEYYFMSFAYFLKPFLDKTLHL